MLLVNLKTIKKLNELSIKYDWNISSAILFNHESELRPKNFLLKKIITTCIKIKKWRG